MNIDNELRQELNGFSVGGKKDPTAYNIYTYLLMNAVYSDTTINGISLHRGQCLTSRRRLSEDTELSERQVRTAISKLVTAKYIEQHTTRNYTIFTVCNYDKPCSVKSNTRTKTKKNGNYNKSDNTLAQAAESITDSEEAAKRYELISDKLMNGIPLTDEEDEFFNNY